MKNSWFCSNFLLCLFRLPLFRLQATIDMLTFTLLMQLGMAIAIAQQKIFLYRRSPHIYRRYGDGGPHIYVDLGMGSPILYSYGDPIHIERGPHIYVVLGTGSPNLHSFGDPGSPNLHDTRDPRTRRPGT